MKQWTGPTDHEHAWDVVVVGSGAAGLTAALTAAERGLRVALYEKAPLFGGTSAVSAGTVWVPNLAQEETDEVVTYLQAQRGAALADDKIRALAEQAAPMMRHIMEVTGFVVEPVAAFPDYHQSLPGASTGRSSHPALFDTTVLGALSPVLRTDGNLPYTQGELKSLGYGWVDFPRAEFEARRDRGLVARGAALVGALLHGAASTGVALFTEAELTDLERHGEGWTLTIDGTRVAARRAVILASGGFEWNRELREQHLGRRLQATCSPVGMNTGIALRLALAQGAGAAELDQAWWAPLMPAAELSDDIIPGTFFRIERMGPGSITVDAAAMRFVNESLDYNTFIRHGLAAHDDQPFEMHIVFDERFRNRFGFLGRGPGEDLPGVTVADDIESLALAVGLDPGALRATVDDFNADAHNGVDTRFGRGESSFDRYYGDHANPYPNPCLAPLEEGPFYAARLLIGGFGSSGGVTTDATGAVTRPDGTAIAGLYAVGNASCQPFASGYPGAGATLGPGMTMGYLTGRAL